MTSILRKLVTSASFTTQRLRRSFQLATVRAVAMPIHTFPETYPYRRPYRLRIRGDDYSKLDEANRQLTAVIQVVKHSKLARLLIQDEAKGKALEDAVANASSLGATDIPAFLKRLLHKVSFIKEC